ncbi:hypothetical protein [Nocardia bovistercoris]|uniref:Uncharacterized protein n=1 Tax=Nocardia bovistercoris TaxID=2785916 RepID=A0A931IF82_9NOCA|nr:hypothetical protein [Nocardia bovistercoris]MBH0779280.1 hypothetical protein [Nocardia bovistercoris]
MATFTSTEVTMRQSPNAEHGGSRENRQRPALPRRTSAASGSVGRADLPADLVVRAASAIAAWASADADRPKWRDRHEFSVQNAFDFDRFGPMFGVN